MWWNLIIQCCPAQDLNCPFVQHLHAVYAPWPLVTQDPSDYQIGYREWESEHIGITLLQYIIVTVLFYY